MPSNQEFDKPLPLGVLAQTGQPMEELSDEAIRAFRKYGRMDADVEDALEQKDDQQKAHLGVLRGYNPNKLDHVGWGMLLSPNLDPAIKAALEPLIELRRQQVPNPALFKIYEGAAGFRPGDTAKTWLVRQPKQPDFALPVDPRNEVPYYITIVAPPDQIPFEFQYLLDVQWGVGRLWFSTPGEFAEYAKSVVRYETEPPRTSRQMAIFSTRHEFDRATQALCDQGAAPLATEINIPPSVAEKKFQIQRFLAEDAARANLERILRGEIPNGPPAVLFSGSHGMCFRSDDLKLADSQGAIVCQDWEGFGKIAPEHYFDFSNVPVDANIHGMIHFLFACYGAGWPQFDDYKRTSDEPVPIAPKPALARLPQALLAHPRGGAIAVIGHVDRAWTHSFQSPGGGTQLQGFTDVLGSVMQGDRLGWAMDQFNTRWGTLSTELLRILDQMTRKGMVAPKDLGMQWVARNDARNYIVFGDPAVRLRVDDMRALT